MTREQIIKGTHGATPEEEEIAERRRKALDLAIKYFAKEGAQSEKAQGIITYLRREFGLDEGVK